jgi:hypothetical protein
MQSTWMYSAHGHVRSTSTDKNRSGSLRMSHTTWWKLQRGGSRSGDGARCCSITAANRGSVLPAQALLVESGEPDHLIKQRQGKTTHIRNMTLTRHREEAWLCRPLRRAAVVLDTGHWATIAQTMMRLWHVRKKGCPLFPLCPLLYSFFTAEMVGVQQNRMRSRMTKLCRVGP